MPWPYAGEASTTTDLDELRIYLDEGWISTSELEAMRRDDPALDDYLRRDERKPPTS